ncbi:DUF2715 domain-containing protein [Treponema putidum]|uniref:Outer membrane protein beta-barrel domain-containing protein n=2 Tax=Treponema putidum TaxID=221027 RepID=A0AAE9MWK1_9SPIR|nr:DUF2715 domain-containing protein [Treponema putidum]AIN93302.1 hypothetical protein JO40_03495 [Treponema putidum]TWI76674.1 hypothetical protein JM98_01767 [Treponema putidum]UTY29542.1 hypothetical protein E4N76_11640 [Treponema putidum]UTY32026.1 hypothetical protein E4N75_11480 [Treponema putidum]UTY34403.1 hypothetical protein E4N74_10630 [Treponema putidum]
MKKFIFIVLVLGCILPLSALDFDFMDISGDVGLGYMNHNMVTVYNTDSLKANLAQGLGDALGQGNLTMDAPKSVDSYNALALGLKLKISYVYANISIGFPFTQIPTGDDPLGQKLKDMGATNKLNNSVIVDGQIGLGINILKSLPVNLFVGGGLGINYIQTKRKLPDEYVKTIKDKDGNIVARELNETRSIAMAGLGINAALNYYFTKNIGISFDIKDTVYFIPMSNQRYYKGKAINGSGFTYTITSDGKQDINSLINYSWANNLALRLAVAFKL